MTFKGFWPKVGSSWFFKSRAWAIGIIIGQWAHVLTDMGDSAGVNGSGSAGAGTVGAGAVGAGTDGAGADAAGVDATAGSGATGTASGAPAATGAGQLSGCGPALATTGAGAMRLGTGAPAWLDMRDRTSNDVRALLEDPEGSLWIGTFGAGLERLRLAVDNADIGFWDVDEVHNRRMC